MYHDRNLVKLIFVHGMPVGSAIGRFRSSVGSATVRVMTEEDLSRSVEAAFGSVPKPGRGDIAPHRCTECDELAEDLAPHTGFSLPDAVFKKHVWDMPLLSDDAKRYYLPAWLLRVTKSTEPWSDAGDALVMALDGEHRWDPLVPYSTAEWLAIDAVLALLAQGDDPVSVENAQRARASLPKVTQQNVSDAR